MKITQLYSFSDWQQGDLQAMKEWCSAVFFLNLHIPEQVFQWLIIFNLDKQGKNTVKKDNRTYSIASLANSVSMPSGQRGDTFVLVLNSGRKRRILLADGIWCDGLAMISAENIYNSADVLFLLSASEAARPRLSFQGVYITPTLYLWSVLRYSIVLRNAPSRHLQWPSQGVKSRKEVIVLSDRLNTVHNIWHLYFFWKK